MSHFDFGIKDIARTVAETVRDLLRKERKEILEHLERRISLLQIKAGDSHDSDRARNFHARLCALESAVRRLNRELGNR